MTTRADIAAAIEFEEYVWMHGLPAAIEAFRMRPTATDSCPLWYRRLQAVFLADPQWDAAIRETATRPRHGLPRIGPLRPVRRQPPPSSVRYAPDAIVGLYPDRVPRDAVETLNRLLGLPSRTRMTS